VTQRSIVALTRGGDCRVATVLIVEDEPTILVLAESVLQHAGYSTVSAATLAEAEAILRSGTTRIDLVATDIGLGEELDGGLKLAQMAAQEHPGTPVLYVSGRPLTDGMKALFVEPSAFLPKPYTDEQLISNVSSLLRSDERPPQ
jgi:DNA-binding response OmpR family regulator